MHVMVLLIAAIMATVARSISHDQVHVTVLMQALWLLYIATVLCRSLTQPVSHDRVHVTVLMQALWLLYIATVL